MANSLKTVAEQPGYRAGSYVLFGALGLLLLALAFEHIGGFAPCPLCLMQRYAYYLAIPLSFAGLVLLSADQRMAAGIVFLIVGLGFIANAVLGGYHAGAEWGFWPGPDVCATGLKPLAVGGNLLDAANATRVPSCTEPEFRMFGLSFAGWNVMASLALGFLAFSVASKMMEQEREALD